MRLPCVWSRLEMDELSFHQREGGLIHALFLVVDRRVFVRLEVVS